MQAKHIEESIRDVINFCEKEKYVGYSLYDSHNAFFPFEKMGRNFSFLVNQIVKRAPINFRPFWV